MKTTYTIGQLLEMRHERQNVGVCGIRSVKPHRNSPKKARLKTGLPGGRRHTRVYRETQVLLDISQLPPGARIIKVGPGTLVPENAIPLTFDVWPDENMCLVAHPQLGTKVELGPSAGPQHTGPHRDLETQQTECSEEDMAKMGSSQLSLEQPQHTPNPRYGLQFEQHNEAYDAYCESQFGPQYGALQGRGPSSRAGCHPDGAAPAPDLAPGPFVYQYALFFEPYMRKVEQPDGLAGLESTALTDSSNVQIQLPA